MLQKLEVLNAATCKSEKLCMHALTKETKKTRDSTVKLNSFLFLFKPQSKKVLRGEKKEKGESERKVTHMSRPEGSEV